MGFDGDTSQSLTVTSIGSPTDIYLQLLLRNFSVETFSFFTRAVPITFQDGDWELIDLTDGTRCAYAMAKVMLVNLNGQLLGRSEGVGTLGRASFLQGDTTGIPVKGTPISWTESDLGKIDLDRPIDMGANPPAWCMGWYRHPVLSYDTAAAAISAGASPKLGSCQIDDTMVFAWAKYASIFLKEGVTSSSVAMERLKRYDAQSYNLIIQKKGENLSRYTRGLYGNSSGLVSSGFAWWEC